MRRGLERFDRSSTPVLLVALLLLMAGFVWWYNLPLLEDIFTVFALTLVMVMGFQLFMGNSGILNWSFVGYVGIGAFASAIFSMSPGAKRQQVPDMYQVLVDVHLPFPLALLGGAAVAALVAAAVAWPLMRLSDTVGVITQFALLIVINVLLAQWAQVTNGPRTFTLGGTRQTTLWVAVGIAALAIVGAHAFKESSLGLRLRATRDDRHAAAAIGISVVAVRYRSYLVSAAVGAIGGGLYSHYILSITAKDFYMAELFLVLSMVVIGGSMSVSGAFFGAVLVTAARQGLRQAEGVVTRAGVDAFGFTEIVLALLMIAFLVWRPNGLSGGWELTVGSVRRVFSRRRSAA